jgi:multiple sugar transport system ATP-binding protein
MNLIEGKTNGSEFVVAGANIPVTAPNSSADLLLGLRSEHISLNDQSAWRGQVNIVEPTGADTYLVVNTAAGDLTVRVAPGSQVKPGDTVGLVADASQISWFDKTTGIRV